MPRAFKLAALTTGALIAMSLALRVLNPFGVPAPDVSDWVPHLWALGAFTVVALTHSWAPTIAWSALIVGATAAAYGVEGIAREYRALQGDPTPALAILLTVALSIPPLVAAAYATAGTAGGRRARSVDAAAWAGAIGLSALLIWALVRRALDAERGGVPGWAWLGIIAVLWGLGLSRDLRPAVVRTRTRLRTEGRPNRPGAAFVALRVFLDELVPGREAGRAEAAESERGRLAADLHAEVLPSLRRALAEAESGGTVERLAADLRTAVDEVEAMLLARRSIVLEEMGLLSGLEWLAERTEDRSDVRVQILVETDASGPASRDGRSPAAATSSGPRSGSRSSRSTTSCGTRPAPPSPSGWRSPRAASTCASRTTRTGRRSTRRARPGAAGAGSRTCARRRRRPARARDRPRRRRPGHGDRLPLGRLARRQAPLRVAATARTLDPHAPLRDPTDGRRRRSARPWTASCEPSPTRPGGSGARGASHGHRLHHPPRDSATTSAARVSRSTPSSSR